MKNKLFGLILCLALMASSILAGCGASGVTSQSPAQQPTQPTSQPNKPTRTVTLQDGSQVTVPQKAERIAALYGPAYEKLVVLGAEDKIVCESDFQKTNWPWSNVIFKDVNKLPAIANASVSLNVEDLVPYNIDLAFNWANPKTTDAMKNIGLSVVPATGTNAAGSIKEDLKDYAQVLGGDAPAKAEQYAQYFDEKLKMITNVTSAIPENEKATVHFAMAKILATSGNKTSIPALVELAGGKCVESDLNGGTNTVITKEQLISWNPDYIFLDHATTTAAAPNAQSQVKELLAQADYSKLAAVKNNHVYIVPTGVFYWDSGLQRILMVMWMAKTMYPDKFSNLNIITELQSFYSRFFNYSLTAEQAQKILDHVDP
ncbi:MAG: ABC transporter substrate-binding protein [Desulfosporosinus sp.]|nr:ABC transporter substrate-binding protein [Desulfosporosinus sp.]